MLELAAFFDTYIPSNSTSFSGAWSVFPYFESGVVVVSGIGEGLFVLQPVLTPDYTLTATPDSFSVCGAGDQFAAILVDDRNGYTGTINLSATGLPAGSSAVFDPPDVPAPGSSAMTLTVGTTPAGSYSFNVHGSDGVIEHDKGMSLTVFSGLPAAPTLLAPPDGAVNVLQVPAFSWDPGAEATVYDFELASDQAFADLVYSASTAGTSLVSGVSLNALSTYYWRVRGGNLCGPGGWSAVFSFTTREIPAVLLVDDDDNSPAGQYLPALDRRPASGIGGYCVFSLIPRKKKMEKWGLACAASQAPFFHSSPFGEKTTKTVYSSNVKCSRRLLNPSLTHTPPCGSTARPETSPNPSVWVE